MKKTNRIIAAIAALVMLLSMVPETMAAEAPALTVSFSAQKDGAFLFNKKSITVTDGLAEKYGYTPAAEDHNGVAITSPTVFDALAAVHKELYGDAFSEATEAGEANTNPNEEYLAITSSGWITKAFAGTGGTGFLVNGKGLDDGIQVGEWGATAYNADTARLKDGDNVEFYFYQDTEGWGDWYTYFEESEKTVYEGEAFTLSLKGFSLMSAMGFEPTPSAINGADGYITINTVNADGSLSPALQDKDGNEILIDANGKASLSFSEAGEYIVTANGFEGSDGAPITAPWCKVTVQKKEEMPSFENIQFLKNAIKDYDKYSFSPSQTEYRLEIKLSTTSSLTLQNTTKYDSEKYTAYAEYTDINGAAQKIDVNSGKITTLTNMPFEESTVKITVSDRKNPNKKTVYTYRITRPRSTESAVKTNGIVLVPTGRELSSTRYKGYAEGTMLQADENGSPTENTGVAKNHYNYKCYLFDQTGDVRLKVTASNNYQHLRASTDGGEGWSTMSSGALSEPLRFSENTAKLMVQIIDDASYTENIKNQRDGFFGVKTCYNVYVERVAGADGARILTADTNGGDIYPPLSASVSEYHAMMPADTKTATLTYTVPEGAVASVGNAEQTPDAQGRYLLELTSTAKTVTVTSKDGFSSDYKFSSFNKKAGYPDKVVDYFSINSQYTNTASYGKYPWKTLSGSAVSLGNFGGYITYYYDEALTDSENHKYGVDFYVYGNSFGNVDSAYEPAAAEVSEDGKTWYQLAGSGHYDDGVLWDYSVTYQKTADGKASWRDSLGNENDGKSYRGAYPDELIYFMNDYAKSDSVTLSGTVLPASNGKIVSLGESVNAYSVKWGYADCFVNKSMTKEISPYAEGAYSNGFDLAWAVDEKGERVDVSGMEFHYVKLYTASNIWHASYADKSAEIAGMSRALEAEAPVGKTKMPEGVTIYNGNERKTVKFSADSQSYSVNIGSMKYVSLSVDGAAADDNIYVNNERLSAGEKSSAVKVTKEAGARCVRIVVQNGECEPQIYYLQLLGNATDDGELTDGININALGTAKQTKTSDGVNYTASVGYRISTIGIDISTDASTEITVNGAEKAESYPLSEGENIFNIVLKNGEERREIVLCVNKAAAPTSSGTMKVYFTLLGDEVHGDSETVHTLKNGGLTTWISRTSYNIDAPATVLDVIDAALKGRYDYVNADGNYISEINGLAEFANGGNSGWMYTVNGKYTDNGVAEQSISDGDVIVMHYSDDYTKESAADEWKSRKPSASGTTHTAAKYTVSFDTDGAGEIAPQTVSAGETAKKPQDPEKEGYVFGGWFASSELSEKYDFASAVTKDLTLYAAWTKTEPIFSDVDDDEWFAPYIKAAAESGLMRGVSETEFSPRTPLTRAMVMTILYRMEGEPEVSLENNSYTQSGAWYEKAIAWAYENEIMNGVSETDAAAEKEITREQLAAVIFRYAKSKGCDIGAVEHTDITAYSDYSEISEYAIPAFCYTVGSGILKGRSENTLNPKAVPNRAEAAAVLVRLAETMNQ